MSTIISIANIIGEPSPRGIVPLLLDFYPATAAYSLRKLRHDYTGSAIRVRRDSDNTEQDIGFSGKDLDTAALTSFCTGTNGFVVTWYDQQGSNNATQGTAGSQPKIYDSSTGVVLEDGKPALDFLANGGTVEMFANGLKDLPLSSFSWFAAHRTHTLASSTPALTWEGADDVAYFSYIFSAAIGGRIFWRNLGSATEVNSGDISGQNVLYSFQYSDSLNEYNLNRNGSNVVNVSTSGTAGPFSSFSIGSNAAGTSYGGKWRELIIYNSDQSANRTAIESNINGYYEIYP